MIVLTLSLVLIGFCFGNEADFRTLDSVKQEMQCSLQGGICTIAKDCPSGRLAEQGGLCPMQRRLGVECCYGQSRKETRCQKRGGICLPGKAPCSPRLIFLDATDCPNDHTCCIMVY